MRTAPMRQVRRTVDIGLRTDRIPPLMPDREILEVDVLFVGAGPAGLAGAIRLAQLAKAAEKTLNITVIEKAKEVGAHTCSGAVMDPRAIRELIPDFEAQGAPLES